MTMTVFLVRHAVHSLLGGSLVGRNQCIGLNSEGLWQAGRLAEYFSQMRIAAVQSSPQLRARQTARAIAAAARMPFLIVSEIDEINFGDWTGRSFEELASDPRWRNWNEERASACVPNGENMLQVQERVCRHLDHIATAYANERVVMVTHAETIRAAILRCRGMPLQDFVRVQVDPASVTTLLLDADGGEVVRQNQPFDMLVAA